MGQPWKLRYKSSRLLVRIQNSMFFPMANLTAIHQKKTPKPIPIFFDYIVLFQLKKKTAKEPNITPPPTPPTTQSSLFNPSAPAKPSWNPFPPHLADHFWWPSLFGKAPWSSPGPPVSAETKPPFVGMVVPSTQRILQLKVCITTYKLLTARSNTIQPSNYNDKFLKLLSDARTPQKNSLCFESRKCCKVFLKASLPFCQVQLKWQKVLHFHMKPWGLLRLRLLRESKLSPMSKKETSNSPQKQKNKWWNKVKQPSIINHWHSKKSPI